MKIVLAHGVLGFGVIDVGTLKFAYFKGVKKHFEENHHDVREPAVSPVRSVEARAKALSKEICSFATDTNRAVIIAHSMGGLDARVALKNDDVAKRVSALVTIGTPHLGSPIANLLSPLHLLRSLGFEAMGLEVLASMIALRDLTTDVAGGFEEAHPDRVELGVDYYYIAGIGRNGDAKTSVAFAPFAALVGGTNDGVVSLDSARRHNRDLMAEWPVDHAEEVGWDLDDPAAEATQDHLDRYDAIIERLSHERRAP